MASLNRVVLIGNLTRDPELRYLPSGTSVTKLRIAVNRNWTGRDGEPQEEVSFFDVSVFGRQAETCNEYLSKGSPIALEGRLRSREWETQDGQRRSAVEVVANNVQFLGRPGQRADVEEPPGTEEIPSVDEIDGQEEEEIPF